MCQNGDMFKCKLQYSPYFYLQIKDDREMEVEAYLRRKFEGKPIRLYALSCSILHGPCAAMQSTAR